MERYRELEPAYLHLVLSARGIARNLMLWAEGDLARLKGSALQLRQIYLIIHLQKVSV